jgi:hypothetical protein
MVDKTEIEHVLFYEENGNLCYRLTKKHSEQVLIQQGALFIMAVVFVIYFSLENMVRYRTGEAVRIPNLAIVFPAIVMIPWFCLMSHFAKHGRSPIVVDLAKQTVVDSGGKQPISLEKVSGIVIAPETGDSPGSVLLKESFADQLSHELRHLTFVKRDSAEQAAALIATYLKVPVVVRSYS